MKNKLILSVFTGGFLIFVSQVEAQNSSSDEKCDLQTFNDLVSGYASVRVEVCRGPENPEDLVGIENTAPFAEAKKVADEMADKKCSKLEELAPNFAKAKPLGSYKASYSCINVYDVLKGYLHVSNRYECEHLW